MTPKEKSLIECFRMGIATPRRCQQILQIMVSGLDLDGDQPAFSHQDIAKMILTASEYVAEHEKGG